MKALHTKIKAVVNYLVCACDRDRPEGIWDFPFIIKPDACRPVASEKLVS